MLLGRYNMNDCLDIQSLPFNSITTYIHNNPQDKDRIVYIYRNKVGYTIILNEIPHEHLNVDTIFINPSNDIVDCPCPQDYVLNYYNILTNEWEYVVHDIKMYYDFYLYYMLALKTPYKTELINNGITGFVTVHGIPSNIITNHNYHFTTMDSLHAYVKKVRDEASVEFTQIIHTIVTRKPHCSTCTCIRC